MKETKPTEVQPLPVKNKKPAIWDLVMADMKAKDQAGAEKYKTRLQPFNGRSALKDAYQENLDMGVYLRQEIEERKELMEKVKNLGFEFDIEDDGRIICEAPAYPGAMAYGGNPFEAFLECLALVLCDEEPPTEDPKVLLDPERGEGGR